MLQLSQDLYLPKHVVHRVFLDDLDLVHVLHGVHFLSVFLLHDAYLAVVTIEHTCLTAGVSRNDIMLLMGISPYILVKIVRYYTDIHMY